MGSNEIDVIDELFNVDVFSGRRLHSARSARGLTLTSLSSLTGVSKASIAQYENGKYPPLPETIQRFVTVLRFPASYFFADPLDEIPEAAISFRSRRDLSDTIKEKVRIKSAHASNLVSRQFRKRFNLPPLDVPVYSGIDPEVAARMLRNEWGLANAPIGNLVHIVEAKGVEVYWLNEPVSNLDGLSFQQDARYFIFLNTHKESGERTRFDLAHELAHLCLHRDRDKLNGRQAEAEANAFAAAFLMPRETFGQEAPITPQLPYYMQLKPKWGVSVAAMIRRSHDIGKLSKDQYYRAFKDISVRGWRTDEPHKLQRERSKIHSKIYDALLAKGITPSALATRIDLLVDDLWELTPVSKDYPMKLDKKNHLSLASGYGEHLQDEATLKTPTGRLHPESVKEQLIELRIVS